MRSLSNQHDNSFQALVKETPMSNIVYIVGLVVIVLAVLSFFGLR